MEHLQQAENSARRHIWQSFRRFSSFFVLLGIYAKDDKRAQCLNIVAKIYSGLIMCISIITFLLYFPYIFNSFPCTTYFLYTLGNASMSFWLAVTYGIWIYINRNVSKLCSSLEKTLCVMNADLPGNIHRKTTILLVIMVINFIVNLTSLLSSMKSTFSKMFVPELLNSVDSYYLNIFHDPVPNFYLAHQFLIHITCFLQPGIITLVGIYFACWCYLSYICFDAYELKLKKIIQSKSLASPVIEELRLNFEECLKFAVKINKYFSVFLGFTFACFITVLCSCIYLTASSKSDMQATPVSLLTIFLGIVSIMVPPIISNSKVGLLMIIILVYLNDIQKICSSTPFSNLSPVKHSILLK